MTDYKAEQAARAAAAAALQAANPHLLPAAGVKGGSLQAAAKNLRIELARAFAGVKFSVTSERFSMGDAIRVGWIDGPTAAQVDEIANRYKAGSFDGMTDSYSYDSNAWTDAFGDAKYVTTSRSFSDAAVAACARRACAKWGVDVAKFPIDGVVAAYRQGALRAIRLPNMGHFDLGDLVYQELARRTYSLNKTPASAEMVEAS